MKLRLQTLLTSEKMPSSKFAEIIGVNRSSISHLLSGRNNPSLDVLQKVLVKFPQINPDWLLLGQGNMYRNKNNANLLSTPNVLPFKEDIAVKEALEQTYKPEKDENMVGFKETKETPVYERKNEEKPSVKPSQESIKKLEKIMFFYTDHTFEVFHQD